MDPRTRILRALHGESIDGVPWSCYPGIVPAGQVERELRNRGMALIVSVPVCLRDMPHVQVLEREAREDGQRFIYRTFRTPVGEVTEKRRVEAGYGSQWIVEHPGITGEGNTYIQGKVFLRGARIQRFLNGACQQQKAER